MFPLFLGISSQELQNPVVGASLDGLSHQSPTLAPPQKHLEVLLHPILQIPPFRICLYVIDSREHVHHEQLPSGRDNLAQWQHTPVFAISVCCNTTIRGAAKVREASLDKTGQTHVLDLACKKHHDHGPLRLELLERLIC